MRKLLPIIFIVLITAIFSRSFLFQGKLPIPADTIVGLYHPFRDFYAKDYPRGIPFKNFLITDPVRQQYPWRDLSISKIKNGELPLWSPYSLAGTPLLANFQSSVFYPLNILFFLLPLNLAWGMLILVQPLLAGIFLYLYLKNLNLSKIASLFGGLTFSFSGFFISWLEWGTVLHSALWLSLILLAIDKIFYYFPSLENSKLKVKGKNLIVWSIIFVFSLTSSFFAGHLQTFFYVGTLSMIYMLVRWWQYGKSIKTLLLFTICYSLFIILTSPQWIPTLQFINLSARGVDQIDWQKAGWFLPWQNLIQFLAPDFFGNPTTLNYWGVWNYGEFISYVGLLPLIFAILAMFSRFDKKSLFSGLLFFISLSFVLPTPWAKLPYQLQIPFFSTAQPTRILFLTDFSLAVLATLGLDWFLKNLNGKVVFKNTLAIAIAIGEAFLLLWIFVVLGQGWFDGVSTENVATARRNLILPTGTLIASIVVVIALTKIISNKKLQKILIITLLAIAVFDLLRFGEKFTPFTDSDWLFPKTKTLEFLQNQQKPFRIMSTDSRIFPPNFSMIYQLESVDGYDPLYLKRYGELIAASERGESNISAPFGFNRIITPKNYNSKIIDLLNVKYILSLEDLSSPKLKKVFQEGETRVYENLNVLPRAFFVEGLRATGNRQEAIGAMFARDFNARKLAVVELDLSLPHAGLTLNPSDIKLTTGKSEITFYSENKVAIEATNTGDGFLVLADSFYPTWKATIDGSPTKIYLTDYDFRGILVPKGKHKVEFYITLF